MFVTNMWNYDIIVYVAMNLVLSYPTLFLFSVICFKIVVSVLCYNDMTNIIINPDEWCNPIVVEV